jgi:polyphenol oxidase
MHEQFDQGRKLMHRNVNDRLVYYTYKGLEPLAHGVFTRYGGVSPAPWDSLNTGGSVGDAPEHVRENHHRMLDALGIPHDQVVTTWQVHSDAVLLVEGPMDPAADLVQADAMITAQPGIALSMRFADCIPLLYYDPVRKAIGLAHAGWRGAVRGIAGKTVQAMERAFGTNPADLRVVIGPGICGACYAVGEEVVSAVRLRYGAQAPVFTVADGATHLDLWQTNALDLEQHGVAQIEVASQCTFEDDAFFSHRRDAGATGRFGVVIRL